MQTRILLRRAALLATVSLGMRCPTVRWRAQPPFDPADVDTWVGPYRRALGEISPRFEPLVWRPPNRTGQTGADSMVWSPVVLKPLLSSTLGGPASFVGICGRVPPEPLRDHSFLYDAELEAPVAHPPGAALGAPPLPPDAGPVELTFAIRLRLSPVEAPCDTSDGVGQVTRISFRAWRNSEGRWRVQEYGATVR